ASDRRLRARRAQSRTRLGLERPRKWTGRNGGASFRRSSDRVRGEIRRQPRCDPERASRARARHESARARASRWRDTRFRNRSRGPILMPRSLFSIALLLGAVSLPALPAGVPAPVETTPSRTNEESTSVAAPAPPTAIVEVIDAVAPWVVAIKVERTKDVDGPRVNNRRLTREAREYFDRPNEEVTGVLVHPRGEIVTS